MDVQLQELIEKIKKDGIASAEVSAKQIIQEAEKRAEAIVAEAQEKADGIIKNAKNETARLEKASEDAITQAGRNLIISFRDGINREINALITKETEKAFDKDLMKKLIPDTVKAFAAKMDAKDISVLLPAKDLKVLESTVKSALKSQISKGLEIKGDASLNSGFRIGAKDGSAFYDFSAEEVAGLFSAYLNPKTTQLLKNASAEIAADEKKPETGAVSAEKPVAKTAAKKAPAKTAAKTTVKKAAEKAPAKKAVKGKK